MHEASHEVLQKHLGDGCLLGSSIPDLAAINTATSLGLPVVLHAKNSVAAKVFQNLVHELTGAGYIVRTKAA